MLYYDRVDSPEGIDVKKTSKSKGCDIFFYQMSFKFQPNVHNGCNVLLMMFMNLSNITIWNIKSANYCGIISGISKSGAINLMLI